MQGVCDVGAERDADYGNRPVRAGRCEIELLAPMSDVTMPVETRLAVEVKVGGCVHAVVPA
jgi:hypothetical protein